MALKERSQFANSIKNKGYQNLIDSLIKYRYYERMGLIETMYLKSEHAAKTLEKISGIIDH